MITIKTTHEIPLNDFGYKDVNDTYLKVRGKPLRGWLTAVIDWRDNGKETEGAIKVMSLAFLSVTQGDETLSLNSVAKVEKFLSIMNEQNGDGAGEQLVKDLILNHLGWHHLKEKKEENDLKKK